MSWSRASRLGAALTLLLLLAAACLLLLVRQRSTPAASPARRADDAQGRAAARISQTVRDLGHTTIRKKWDVVFGIRNAGTRRLVLNELDAACDCRDRVRRTHVVPPQRTAWVSVLLDTRFATGPTEASLSLTTNDAARPRIRLLARAWVDASQADSGARQAEFAESSILSRP